MSSIRERLLGTTSNNSTSSIRDRLNLNEQTNTNTSTLKILKKSDAFDDGYQFGDVTKTIGATVGDLATNIGKGFLNTVEGVADAGQYLLADVAKGLSKVKLLDVWDKNARSWLKEKANALEENAKFDSTGAIFGENEKESDNLLKKGWTEKLDKNSVSDNMLDSVAQGIGNVAAMAGTAYVGGQALGTGTTTTSFLNSFSSAFGNAKSEAYKNGADDKTALETAIVSGFSEAISEQFFDALPGMKVEGWGSKLTGKIANSVSKHFGSKAGKATLKVLDSIGEGAEEVISNALNAVGNDIVHYIDNDYDYGMEEQTGNIFKDTKNAVLSEDSLASFISASLTSAIINGGNTFITEKQKKDIIKAYASDNNITIDEATNIFNSIVETNTSNQLNEKTDFNDKVELEKEETAKLLNLIRSNNIDLKKYSSEQKRLQEQLASIQNQNMNVEVTDIVDTTNVNNNDTQKSAPLVQDIVEMENRQKSNIDLPIFNNSISNAELSLKEQQNSIIQNSNPVGDDYHTWIRSADDIKTFEETLNDSDYKEYFEAGEDFDETYTAEMARKALETGKITVYSSYPIEQGTFVSPSKMEAESYSGNGKVYSKEVSLTDVAWIDPTQGQYAKVSSKIAPVIDTTSVNNTNTAIAPVDISQIKQAKGNVPINQELLNKYNNVSELINENLNNYDGKINIKNNIEELNSIDLDSMNQKDLSELAIKIFEKYNNNNVFVNDNNKIMVTKGGIKESINKILYNQNQKRYLKEHLQVFSDLGDIIENATLASQTIEKKARENNSVWNYYLNGLNINNNSYLFEFDVVSRSNGENHYRVQRLERINNKKANASVGNTNNSITPTLETSASYVNNISQSNTNVKSSGTLSTINNMQNNENNTSNLAPTREYFEGKNTNEQSEKLAEILKEKPSMEDNKDGWLKKLATIKFIDKGYYVDKLARKTKNSELSSKYDYSLTANGIANHIIGNGRYDENGNKIGKGLYEIFEPIENSGLLDDFSSYIYHKHNVDRMNLQNRYNEANKAVFGDNMTSEMSEQKVKEYERKYPEFETWANDIYEYNNANLEMLVKYGVISNEDMEYYNKKYPHYVPTIRQNSKQKTQMDFLLGKKASVNNPIKTAKGGNGDIIPLKDAMALRTMQTVNSSLRNNFGLELLNTVETEQIRNKENIDNIVEDINMEELITKGDKTKSATLTVFENGEKITFDISDEIYEALKPSNIYTVKWLNKFNNFRRGLLTEYNPTFMITNPLKDIQDGFINSKYPEVFGKNLIEAVNQIKNKGPYHQLYLANGGSYETYFNYNTGTNIAPSKIDKIAPLRKISEVNEVIEMAPRLAEFISSREAGESIETAMYNANEITTNFKRGGDITKTLDRNGVTFLNAGVQGTVKQIRNVQEARTAGMKGITKLAVRWTIAGLIPTLLMNMIWGDDDDYEELSDYVKNNYYIIGKYGDGEFIRIPKGRVISVLQSFFQNMINGINGEELDLDGFADLIENNLLPNNPEENNLLSPLIQAHNNTTWYGDTLIPTRLQNLPNAEQYDESIDSISIWLGKQLNISPYKINYVLDQYSGAIGDYILPYLTQEAESGSDSFTGKLIAPVKDKFTVDSILKNQNISDFYSLSEELTKKSNSSNATDEDVLKNKYINSIKSDISKLYAEKREIQSSSLKDSEKYNQSKEIQKEINELSKNALKEYQNIELNDNYAIVGGKEYYKNSSNEWSKVDTDSTKYKIANLITKYNDYLKYNEEIKSIKKQYDNSTTRKNAIIKYVNSLNLTIPQKAILIKMNYSSYTNYDNQIINYINNQNISTDEKEEILEDLGFKIRNGKVYSK